MQKKTKHTYTHTHTQIPSPHSLSLGFRKATREKDGKLVRAREVLANTGSDRKLTSSGMQLIGSNPLKPQ